MLLKSALITNIQKCSVHDGPGIRTTVFFKGCPLNCLWCHNPETQRYTKDIMYSSEKCSFCGQCEKRCPNQAISISEKIVSTNLEKCDFCEKCMDFCVNNAREIIGKEYTVEELIKEIDKDKIFYEESGGGVTLSGGEVMMQIDFVEALVKRCKDKGISVAVDTCGYTNFENYKRILDYVDIFLYDLKLINSQKHEEFIGKPNKLIIENLQKLCEYGAKINIRIPLIEGINTDEDNINETIRFLQSLNIKEVNLLPYHDIGMHKYTKLNMFYKQEHMSKPSEKKVEEIKKAFEKCNYHVKVGG